MKRNTKCCSIQISKNTFLTPIDRNDLKDEWMTSFVNIRYLCTSNAFKFRLCKKYKWNMFSNTSVKYYRLMIVDSDEWIINPSYEDIIKSNDIFILCDIPCLKITPKSAFRWLLCVSFKDYSINSFLRNISLSWVQERLDKVIWKTNKYVIQDDIFK